MEDIIAKESVNTTCCYCGVGCGVTAEVVDQQVVSVKGDKNHPANFGRLCVKGSSLDKTQETSDRLLHPIVNGDVVSWDQALEFTADKFKRIVAEHGPDSVAFYLSGQLLTEDYYVANKLMKGFIGTSNVDTNSRLCMASAVVAHKRAFGCDVVPGCYEDLEKANLIVLVGSNLAYAHPIVYQRIVKAKAERPELRVVVLDPRATATCDIADLHLPIRAGSDGFLFNGLLSYLSGVDALDRQFIAEHCEGFDAALSAAEQQVPSVSLAADLCRVEQKDMQTFYEWFAAEEKVVTVFSQGINQSSSGVDKGNAIINCHLATGRIGKEGAAPFSITGQPNAMGGREVGGLANQLAAHMSFDKPEDIERVKNFWAAPNMAQSEGLKAVDMFKAIADGKIKAVWVMATNPVVSMPDADAVKRALQQCELVVVSECIRNTDTAVLADVLFPATTWSEKHGTVTNSERCMSLQKGFLAPPGEARNDWQIICDFAKKLGYEEAFGYQHPVEIFREHARLSGLDNRGRRGFDISAMADISLDEYENFAPIQWPVTDSAPNGTPRMFAEGGFFTLNKKAKLIPISARLPQLEPEPNQVIMNTGRIRDHWHTMSRTGSAALLWGHIDEPFVDVSREDIQRFGLVADGLVRLSNRGSQYLGRVRCDDGVKPGNVFVPMHWNDRYAKNSRADALVNDFTDPICGQPEFKHSPVRIEPFPASWQGFVMSNNDTEMCTEYWAKIPLANGVKFRVADSDYAKPWRNWLQERFPLIDDWTWFHDSSGKRIRAVGYTDNRLSVAFAVAWGLVSTAESRWLEDQLGEMIAPEGRMAILAGRQAGQQQDEGKIICTCFQVGEKTIEAAVAGGCSSVEQLGQKLRCGTNCGSCLPELKSLVRELSSVD